MRRRSSESGNHGTTRSQAPGAPGIAWVLAVLLLVAGLGTACISVGPTLSREAGKICGTVSEQLSRSGALLDRY